jgi:hypothetical protein
MTISYIKQPGTNTVNAAYRPVVFDLRVQKDPAAFTINVVAGNAIAISPVPDVWPVHNQTIAITGSTSFDGSYTVDFSELHGDKLYVFVTNTISPGPAVGNSSHFAIDSQVVCKPNPPVVYLDIYIEKVFYRTICKTLPLESTIGDATYRFDIQDICQEVLSSPPPTLEQNVISWVDGPFKTVNCKARFGYINDDGFIACDDKAPVQGTGTKPAREGDGLQAESFFILNATLQHLHNQNVMVHMKYLKQIPTLGTNLIVPATHRKKPHRVCRNAADVYPIVSTSPNGIRGMRIEYSYDKRNFYTTFHIFTNISTPGVFYIPNGPANLRMIGWGNPVQPDWLRIKRYFVILEDGLGASVLSWENTVEDCHCTDVVTVCFQNYLGTYDTVTFDKVQVTHEDQSSEFQRPLSYPLDKKEGGIQRFNVKSNDTYEATFKCLETEMEWLQELKDSPKAFIAWKGAEGQSKSYIPIVILSGKFLKLKTQEEYNYEFVLEFKLANEYISIRN